MRLYPIGFVHYSPKDSEQGVKEYVIANGDDEVIEYVSQTYRFGDLLGYDEDETSIRYDEEWLKRYPLKLAEANTLGFDIDTEYHYVTGPNTHMIRWYEGEDFKDADNAYYGVIHYYWRDSIDISNEDAAVLVRLGLAKRI